MTPAVYEHFSALQERIVAALEVVDRKGFVRDSWQRPEGGGGTSCIVEEGQVLERGGVNLSRVQGRQLNPPHPASADETHPLESFGTVYGAEEDVTAVVPGSM